MKSVLIFGFNTEKGKKMANEKRLIDVNKVIGAMQKCLDEAPDAQGSVAYFTFEALIECLKQEPIVDAVEVVHGRWEQLGEADYRCSRCGFRFTSADHITMFQYCRCGAKMDGDGNA